MEIIYIQKYISKYSIFSRAIKIELEPGSKVTPPPEILPLPEQLPGASLSLAKKKKSQPELITMALAFSLTKPGGTSWAKAAPSGLRVLLTRVQVGFLPSLFSCYCPTTLWGLSTPTQVHCRIGEGIPCPTCLCYNWRPTLEPFSLPRVGVCLGWPLSPSWWWGW